MTLYNSFSLRMDHPRQILTLTLFFLSGYTFSQAQLITPGPAGEIHASGAQLFNPTSVTVSGNYAYISSNGSNALEISDISNSASPIHTGSISTGAATCVSVFGSYAYVATSNGLLVIDVSDPTRPIRRSSVVFSLNGTNYTTVASVTVIGNYAYVVGDQILEVIDVTNPISPVIIGYLLDGNGAVLKGANQIFVSGNYAYINSPEGSALEIVDISDPKSPTHKSTFQVNASSVFVSGNYAYVTDYGASALHLIDISNPASPTAAGTLTDNTNMLYADGVFVEGNIAYVIGMYSYAISLVDVSDPAKPTYVGSLHEGGSAIFGFSTSVVVVNQIAYVVGGYTNSLELVDVSNPTAPSHEAVLLDGDGGDGSRLSGSKSVALSGSNAIVASFEYLEILDVSNPATPVHKTAFNNLYGVYPKKMVIDGNLVCTAGDKAFQIADITNPQSPTLRGHVLGGSDYAVINGVSDLYVSGNYAYITSTVDPYLEIINITDPDNPIHEGNIYMGESLNGTTVEPVAVKVSGNYAYIVQYPLALQVIDVTNPASPSSVGLIKDGDGGAVLSGANSVFVNGQYAYVTSSGALEIIDISNPAQPTHVASISNADGVGFISPSAVVVNGTYAYVTDSGFKIIDISDPHQPKFAGSYIDTDLQNGEVVISGNYVYGVETNGLSVINLLSPPAPLALAASNILPTTFTANWESVPTATSYQLDVSTDWFQTYLTNLNSLNESGLSDIISGLSPVTTYQYRVRSINSQGLSANSNIITVITKYPQTITFQNIADVTLGGDAFTLSASSSSGLPVGFSTKSTKITLNANLVTPISAGRVDITAVQLGNAMFDSARSVTNSFCIDPPAPVITVTPNQLTLTLASSATDGNQWYFNGTPISGATLPTLQYQGPGSYSVASTIDDCISQFSETTIIITENFNPQSAFSFYPNPTESILYLSGVSANALVTVFSEIGKSYSPYISQEGNSLALDVSFLSSGLYIAKIVNGHSVNTIKFVKK